MRLALAVLGTVLVACVAWFFVRSDGAVATSPATLTDPARSERSADGTPMSANDPLAMPSGIAERAATDPSDASNDPALADALTLRVIERASGRPIADAEVLSFDWDADWDASHVLSQRELGELEAWLVSRGRRVRTDALGEARVPKVEHSGIAAARSAGRFAVQDYDRGAERIVIALGGEREFEVHVASSSGADVVGVDVVVRSLEAFGLRMRARTDEHGVARFRHVRPFQREDAPEPCGVTVSALLTSRPELAFDALMELPPRVELVLPPCGAVDVTVVDQGGSVVAASGAFDATVVSDDFFTSHFSTVRERAARGAFRLAPVEVGARFEVVAWFEGMQESAKGTRDGPTRDGEVVAATLRLQALPAAVFRAVDERGQVLVQQRLRVVMRDLLGDWDEGSPLGYSEFVTDDAGRFRVPYDSSDSDSDQEPRRTIELFTTRASDGVELYFHTEFDTEPPSEDREHGDAVFRPAQRIVAGRVLDPLGAPVEGAIVRLYVPFAEESKFPIARNREYDAARHPAWLVSDAQGAFEARGVLDAPRVRVIANARSTCTSPMTEVLVGASDVVLTVPRQGGLEGSIVLPDGVLAHEVSCRWSAPGGPNANAAFSQTQAREASEPGLARFSFDDLPAGRGELAVVLGSQPIVRIADLELQPGAPTRDPRVQRIDMRALMRVLEVRVESPDGSLAPDGVVQTCPSSAPESRSMWSIRRGTARCLVGIEPVDLWIAIVGARRERVTGVVANACTVRMRPPYELELTFRTPEVPSGLLAALEMRGEPQVTCNTATPVSDGASMRFQPAATGRARVRLMRQPDPATGRELRTLGEWSFEVADLDELQTFAFALDPTAVEAASR